MLVSKEPSLEIRQAVLSPAEAELHLFATLEKPIENAILRGHLHGPRCAYSSTIEIAYPIRPLSLSGEEPNVIAGRILIPEPCLWDTDSPFVYEGTIEICVERSPVASLDVSYALRTMQIGPDGQVRLNGREVSVRAAACCELDESKLGQLRDRGVNALREDATRRSGDIQRMADRYGFLVLPFEKKLSC